MKESNESNCLEILYWNGLSILLFPFAALAAAAWMSEQKNEECCRSICKLFGHCCNKNILIKIPSRVKICVLCQVILNAVAAAAAIAVAKHVTT